jgi:hypothetical protein
MRTELIWGGVATLLCSMGAAMAATPSVDKSLSAGEVDALRSIPYSTQELRVGGTRVLVVSQDRGSGLTLQTCFVYRWSDTEWVPIAYVSTTTSKVVAKAVGGRVVLTSKAGRVLLEIGPAILDPAYDPKEQLP